MILGTTVAGMTQGITEVSMTHGTTDGTDIMDGMDMPDGMAASTVHITADGTAHGIRSDLLCILGITTVDLSLIMLTLGEAQDSRQELTDWPARRIQAAEASVLHLLRAESSLLLTAERFQATQALQEVRL